ncbi:hypothetical protein [Natronorubrum tibetense]|uniref:Uncharacterized protein n=1 Tax=Natronorubrum tibetense GA33 TaxID=1114856 RepID=L9VIT4_9EURY|nr:hypothetical protein C496_21679 [Natronorubrum tibetense GA33]
MQVGDRLVRLEDLDRRETANRHDDGRVDAYEFGFEHRPPDLGLVDRRVVILGRAHLDEVDEY